MFIDTILTILLIIAVFKGYRNGFVVAVFSFLAIIIGLAAAMKLSAMVAGWLKETTSVNAAWLPFLSFALIMIVVVLLVRIGARLIQSAMELVLLGWVNKLCGIVLYAALYITVFSVFLFYAEKIHLVKSESLAASRSYSFIKPWGPRAIEIFGSILPIFKGLFEELSHFFDRIPEQIK
jgi:membrane protein required for colicin V production